MPEKSSPERKYPPFYEKAVPLALAVVLIAIIVLLIVIFAVFFHLLPGAG